MVSVRRIESFLNAEEMATSTETTAEAGFQPKDAPDLRNVRLFPSTHRSHCCLSDSAAVSAGRSVCQ